MNLDNITKVWDKFAMQNKTELKHKERVIKDAVQSTYLINYANEVATFSFIGLFSKSNEGVTTNRTSIILEFNNRFGIPNLEVKKSAESNPELSDLKRKLLEMISPFNGTSIDLRDEFARIDTDHIFTERKEFDDISNLALILREGTEGA